jgi:hypothetical protein
LEADTVVFAVGGSALNAMVRNSPGLAKHAEFRRFAQSSRDGVSVLATRLYLDRTAEAWHIFFDITKLHGGDQNESIAGVPGSAVEVDY